MTRSDELTLLEGDDPIDSDDLLVLRAEILRGRDAEFGAAARREILDDRIEELEAQVEALAADRDRLQVEVHRLQALVDSIRRNPVVRPILAVVRPFRRARAARAERIR